MFNLAQVIGDGSNKTLLTMSSLVEGSIHSTTIYNSTGSLAIVVFTVGDKSFSFTCTASSNTKVDMTINVPAGSVVSVNAPTGVTVTSSYIISPVDATGALTVVQEAANSAIQAKLAAEAVLDTFDDKYLGAKTSDPVTDNDGNALVAGAFYINTTTELIRAYTGNTWVNGISAISGVSSVNGHQGEIQLMTIDGQSLVGIGDVEIPKPTAHIFFAMGV